MQKAMDSLKHHVLKGFSTKSINSSILRNESHSSATFGPSHNQQVLFDLSDYPETDCSEEDDYCEGFDCELDLNKTYSSKTMTRKEISLMTSALDESSEII